MFKRKKQTETSKIRHLIAQLNPTSPITEQYRTVRTNLQFSAVDGALQAILITSPGPAAGKSITAANLAVVYAQQKMKTLLIDADLRKPTVHYTFRLNNLKGFSNVLINESTLEDAVQRSDIEQLDVLSSGPLPPNPAELLASNRMKDILNEMKQTYDFIIFDTPPTLAVTDAKILANIVDGTLLIVRSGATEIADALKAKETLETAKAPIIGSVLNDVEKKDMPYYTYYGE